MKQAPDFDVFELLGIEFSADAATIDRAYKARIRYVHPDIAGTAGLNETKRLNIAREWLLDPELRGQLPKPSPRWGAGRTASAAPPPPPPPSTGSQPHPSWEWDTNTPRHARDSWRYDPLDDDPITFDYGVRSAELRVFFGAIRSLTPDERARVTYSLGEEPPIFFDEFKDLVSETLWARSRALNDAIERIWAERESEDTPLLFPRGRVFGNGAVVANAYAQWQLMGGALQERLVDLQAIEALAARCTSAWEASIGHARYSVYQREVTAFLDDARLLTLNQAERLSRAWHRDMDGFVYGKPGEDWFPGTLDHADPELVSARLAAVDASRIFPPEGLATEHIHGFHCGLRLTAHVLALGGVEEAGRDYLRPWREALDPTPSFRDRARWGMPLG